MAKQSRESESKRENTMKLYEQISLLVGAITNCEKNDNQIWKKKHQENLEQLVKEYLPRGSGFDNGSRIDLEECSYNKLVFFTAFHHMHDDGYYTHWTNHKVVVTPAFVGKIDIVLPWDKGNADDITDHIHVEFYECLMRNKDV